MEKLLNVAQTAEVLNVSASNIYTMVQNKALPAIRVNNWSLRFSPAAIQQWVTDNTNQERNPTHVKN